MRPALLLTLALTAMTLAGCKKEQPRQAKLAETLPELPLPPGGRAIGRHAGEDALVIGFRTPAPVDTIAHYYRGVFNQRQWRLVSDVRSGEGGITLYAEQGTGKPPMWVRILPDSQAGGTLVEVAGARVSGLSASEPELPAPTPDSVRRSPPTDTTRPKPIP